MKDIDISFIIPIYNTENYIKKCVLSIIQNCPAINYEILLINDGSNDNSASICNTLSVEYTNVRTIHINNSGVSNARNIGIKESNGKWISFIDSDDFIKEGLDFVSQFFQDPEIELIHYGWTYIHNTMKHCPVSDKTEILTCEELFKRKIFHGYVWSYIFKKEILSKYQISFSTDMKYAEDWEFIFKYYSFLEKKIVLLHQCIYNQVCREGSATNQKLGYKYIHDNFKMYKSVLSLSNKNSSFFKKCTRHHLYSINIWMVNNVIYKDYNTLISQYRHNVNFLLKSNITFAFSPIIYLPIIFKNKFIYLSYISFHHKIRQ